MQQGRLNLCCPIRTGRKFYDALRIYIIAYDFVLAAKLNR